MIDDNKKPTHRAHLPMHDYTEPCIYHITMVCSDRMPLFGRMVGDRVEDARVEFTPLGLDIFRAIDDIPRHCAEQGRDVQILAHAVMPDHIHFVLYVRQRLDVKLSLLIRGFKQGCNKALRRWLAWAASDTSSHEVGCPAVLGSVGLEKSAQPNGEPRPDAIPSPSVSIPSSVSSLSSPSSSLSTPSSSSPSSPLSTPSSSSLPSPLPTPSSSSSLLSPSGSAVFPRQPQPTSSSHHTPSLPPSPSISDTPDIQRYASIPPAAFAYLSEQLRNCRSQRVAIEYALFEPDFDETRLRRKGQLQSMLRYVHNNPQHRWLKQHMRDRLRPIRGIMIGDQSYDAIGNLILLGLPRWQVWVRSRWDDQTRRDYKNNCILKARNGHALVSPFVSPHEAAVRDVALSEGHSVIVLVSNGFSDFAQCPGGLYPYCVRGQVLVLVPSELPHIERKDDITRQECVMLNARASTIVET